MSEFWKELLESRDLYAGWLHKFVTWNIHWWKAERGVKDRTIELKPLVWWALLLEASSMGWMFNLWKVVRTKITGFPGGTVVKNLPANAGDAGSISGLERFPGRGNGNSSQYSCLKNSMDRGVWWATVHGLAKKVRHDWATEHIYTHTQGLRLQSGW